ncbi:MAG: PAS domain S-box protein [Candidatus Omnitrophica bacterium]|nr:PAS domain S-box protein [Candidatus Omnitrophota bacterium]
MDTELKKLQDLLTFKQTEIENLKREAENYKEILSHFPGIIVVLNPNGIIEYINENGAKIIGYYSTEELIYQNWFEKCIPENIRDSLKFVFNKIIEGHIEEFKYYENLVETKFKTQKLIGWRNSYLKDAVGNITKVISYGTEISKDILRKDKVGELTKIFEVLPEAIHLIDREYIILYINETFKKWNILLGLSTDVIGKNIFNVFPFLSEKVREEYEEVFKTGEILITKEENRLKDKVIITETRKIPLFEKEKVSHIITFIREITNFLNF